MKNKFKLLFVALIFVSCNTYIDLSKNEGNGEEGISGENWNLNFLRDHNEFVYKSNISAKADEQEFEKTHFSVSLPKRMVNWTYSNSTNCNFFFEFDNKQIIYIYSPPKGIYKTTDWELRETTKEKIKSRLIDYWNKRNYKEAELEILKKDHMTKVYTDSRVEILLYNIDPKNFDEYKSLISSFKYLN